MPTEDLKMLDEMYSDPDFVAFVNEIDEKNMEEMMNDYATKFQ